MKRVMFIFIFGGMLVLSGGCEKEKAQIYSPEPQPPSLDPLIYFYCQECEPFVGTYEATHKWAYSYMMGDTAWISLPYQYYYSRIDSGFVKLENNTRLTLGQSGGTFSGDFWTGYDWHDYSFTNSKCKYIIIDQSTLKIIQSFTSWYDTTYAHFHPELTSLTDRIDSIIWNNLLYIRQ